MSARGVVRRSVRTRFVLAAYAASGAAGLIYEVVWHRGLALVLGSTSIATAIVLAVFLGGLAFGSYVFGATASGTVRPLRLYAVLELAIALSAAGLMLVWSDASWWSSAVGWLAGDSSAGLLVTRLLIASLFLLLPVVLMGGTFPVLARYGLAPFGEGWVPVLYAVNTQGAVAGAAASGFLLLPALGAARTTAVAMALNGAAAVVALLLERGQDQPAPSWDSAVDTNRQVADPVMRRRAAMRAVWLILALSGAVTLAFEVVWTRALTLVLGSSTYAFATMLATYIGGLAIGALAGARAAARTARPLAFLVWTQVATAVGALVALHLMPQLPIAFLYMFRLTGDHPVALQLGMSALAALIMFPTAISQGMVFPVGVHVAAGGRRDAGAPVGLAYAVSTIGAVAGALAATFWLIPTFGIDGAAGALAATSLIAAGIAVLHESHLASRSGGFFAEGAVALTALLLVLLLPRWDPLRLGTGVYRDAPRLLELYASPRDFPRIFELYRPLFYRDGVGASVLVYERPSLAARPHRVLAIDGKVEASTADDMPTQVLSGHLPLMVGARPGRALIIGVASGITLGAVARHPFQEMVAVEIEPAVLEAAHLFREFNHDVLKDPRVRLVVDDGRNYLARASEDFDVIVSEPSNPWIPGSARLFTLEFFELVRRRLRENGVFVQWIQMYGLEPKLLRTVVRTFRAVFPEALAVRPSDGDLLLLGAARPVRLDYARTAEILTDPDVASDLQRIGIREPAEVAIRIVIGGADVQAYAGKGALNADDNALVEFGASGSLYRSTIVDNVQALASHAPAVPMPYIDGLGHTAEARAEIARAVARAYLRARRWSAGQRAATWSLEQTPAVDGWWLVGDAASQLGDLGEAWQAWKWALSLDPAHAAARLGLARIAWRSGDTAEAERLLLPLLGVDRADPAASYLGGLIAARRGAHASATRQFSTALTRWPDVRDRWAVRYALTAILRARGDEAGAAAEERRLAEDLKAWCELLEEAPPPPTGGVSETEAVLDLVAVDRAGVTGVMTRYVLEPLTHFYRGKTLYLLGYRAEAAEALERAIERGGCKTARAYLARARNSGGLPGQGHESDRTRPAVRE